MNVVCLKNCAAQMSKSVKKYTVEEIIVQLSVVMCSVLDQFSKVLFFAISKLFVQFGTPILSPYSPDVV